LFLFFQVPDVSLIKGLVVGKAERLESQFRLTYNQILNLLRVEDFDPYEMMSRSFSESSSQKQVPGLCVLGRKIISILILNILSATHLKILLTI
jgi:superfamily II RNA helicase